MKKTFLLTLLTVSSFFKCYAQDGNMRDTIAICPYTTTITATPVNFKNPKSKYKKMVVGAYEVTPNKDYEYYIFTSPGIAVESLRFTNIEIHRTSDHSLLWGKTTDEFAYKPTRFGLLELSNNSIHLLNYENGKRIWTLNGVQYAGIVNDRIFVRRDEDMVQTYKLENGKRSWAAIIEYQNNGLRCSQYIDSIHDYLYADYIYKIDWTNGHTKSFPTTNTVSNPTSILSGLARIGMVASGFAVGGATGYYVFIIPYSGVHVGKEHELYLPSASDKISAIHSGIISENGKNYYADHKHIICFDDDMEPIWATELPEKKASKSELFIDGENVYMINLGYGMSGKNTKAVGRPFIAGFKKSDGTELFYKELADDKKMIYGYNISADKKIISIMFENEIKNFSIDTHETSTINYDNNNIGTLRKFVNDRQYYVIKDKSFILLHNLTRNKAVYSSKGRIYDLSVETGETSQICDMNAIYFIAKKKGNRMLLIGGDNQEELWFVNGDKANLLTSEMDFYSINDDTIVFNTTSYELKSFQLE